MSLCYCFFFFFKQKTAYEMLRSLVGSEMCIRDSPLTSSSSFVRDMYMQLSDVLGISDAELRAHAEPLVVKNLMQDEEGEGEGGEERASHRFGGWPFCTLVVSCLLYTSDAADEEDSVDLGGRRIIKKKKNVDHASMTARNSNNELTDER
eukprot:TRINITY_DN47081_c0_g1_i1.p1 TRINITY_DN47081_c0_g1~~TRINITY_DN47081_c0_g1_i1.p1  ORF type:complete len:150 (-),score=51.94 TRINITY_DN47081_c0_g1_i1:43-492(-)